MLTNLLTGASSCLMLLTESSPRLELNFDPTQMFTYTNIITDGMMPLVYIGAGFGLGFTIIYSLKSAFR